MSSILENSGAMEALAVLSSKNRVFDKPTVVKRGPIEPLFLEEFVFSLPEAATSAYNEALHSFLEQERDSFLLCDAEDIVETEDGARVRVQVNKTVAGGFVEMLAGLPQSATLLSQAPSLKLSMEAITFATYPVNEDLLCATMINFVTGTPDAMLAFISREMGTEGGLLSLTIQIDQAHAPDLLKTLDLAFTPTGGSC